MFWLSLLTLPSRLPFTFIYYSLFSALPSFIFFTFLIFFSSQSLSVIISLISTVLCCYFPFFFPLRLIPYSLTIHSSVSHFPHFLFILILFFFQFLFNGLYYDRSFLFALFAPSVHSSFILIPCLCINFLSLTSITSFSHLSFYSSPYFPYSLFSSLYQLILHPYLLFLPPFPIFQSPLPYFPHFPSISLLIHPRVSI